jgi:hypothetical protein
MLLSNASDTFEVPATRVGGGEPPIRWLTDNRQNRQGYAADFAFRGNLLDGLSQPHHTVPTQQVVSRLGLHIASS